MARRDDAVVHPFTLASGGDHTRAAEISKMTGDLRLALIQDLNEIADTHLSSIHEAKQA